MFNKYIYLRTVFIVIVIASSTIAIFRWWSLLMLPVTFIVSLLFRNMFSRTSLIISILLLAIPVFSMTVWMSMFESKEDSNKYMCRCRLKEIGSALNEYYAEYGHYPVNIYGNSMDKPLLSWRASLLPLVGANDCNDNIDHSKYWNTGVNTHLASTPLYLFHCPSDNQDNEKPITNYLVVSDNESIWCPNRPTGSKNDLSRSDISNTILLVEWPDSNITWLEPKDISLGELFSPQSKILSSIRHAHYESGGYFFNKRYGFHALFGDGRVRYIGANVPDEVLKAFMSGDNNTEEADILKSYDYYSVNCFNCFLLVIWICSIVYFIKVGSSSGGTHLTIEKVGK